VGSAARGAGDVARNVNQAAAGANEVSKNVQEAVKGVTDIARNINQLAMGTTDVAKNAAEASKGMNDVARNVNAVSGAAKETTRGAADTNSASKELARLAERLQSNVAKFKLAESSAGVREDHIEHLEDAVKAHLGWKHRLERYAEGTSQEPLDAAVVCLDNRCALGIWIHGPGGRRLGGQPEFGQLRNSHARFHQIAGQIVKSVDAHQVQAAKALLEGEFNEVSHETVRTILRLKNRT
jgi:hypothetical protein